MAESDRPVLVRIRELQGDHGTALIPRNWTANFEEEPYLTRPDLVLADSLAAVAATRVTDGRLGPYLNLVTPAGLGDPEVYLIPALIERLGERVGYQLVGESGSGGHVLRLWRYRYD